MIEKMSQEKADIFLENKELQLAGEFIEHTGSHIFLTGKAGTGKTTFLKRLKKNTAKRIVVTAPTGVAAINAGGVTLHSFFQLPFGPFIPGSDAFVKNKERLFRFSKEKKRIIKSLDLLVIDEISMVRADVLDAVDKVLQYHRRNTRAFGGVQLLLIGDLHQLPPVAKSGEWELLKEHYSSVYFFSSLALGRLDIATIELETIYRQSDDRFVDLLNKVRENRLDESGIAALNRRYKEGFLPEENQGYITLTTHNRMADAINEKKLEAIPASAYDLSAHISGDFPEAIYPTSARLSLKVGAQVMFLRNDPSIRKLYYNGKIGKITSISDQSIRVRCPGESESITVEPVDWENIKYTLDQDNQEIVEEVIGRFKQFPLKPAWAITIHKSQGLTFDKAVIDARAAFAQGQVYVALSRCKTFDGLVLSSPVPPRGIETDDAIVQFIHQTAHRSDPAYRLMVEKTAYQQQLLIACFDFQSLGSRFNYFYRLVSGNAGLVQMSGMPDLTEVRNCLQTDVLTVSEKFKHQLHQNFQENSLPVSNAYIQERVKKATGWFQDKLAGLFDTMVSKGALETDNKSLGKKLKNAFDNLKLEVTVCLSGIRSCETGFLPSRYLRAVSKAELAFTPGSAQSSPLPSYGESDIEHPQLFQQLKDWRLRLSKEKNMAAFQILHQRVLIQIAVHLPETPGELKKIRGVGDKTIAKYGDDILGMVQAYRKAHGITAVVLPEKKEDRPQKPASGSRKVPSGEDTKQISFDMFKKGLSIGGIAAERGLVENTVQGHLSHFVEQGDLAVDQVLSPQKQSRMKEALSRQSYPSLKQLKTELGDDFSYGDIKLMTAHMNYLKSAAD